MVDVCVEYIPVYIYSCFRIFSLNATFCDESFLTAPKDYAQEINIYITHIIYHHNLQWIITVFWAYELLLYQIFNGNGTK